MTKPALPSIRESSIAENRRAKGSRTDHQLFDVGATRNPPLLTTKAHTTTISPPHSASQPRLPSPPLTHRNVDLGFSHRAQVKASRAAAGQRASQHSRHSPNNLLHTCAIYPRGFRCQLLFGRRGLPRPFTASPACGLEPADPRLHIPRGQHALRSSRLTIRAAVARLVR